MRGVSRAVEPWRRCDAKGQALTDYLRFLVNRQEIDASLPENSNILKDFIFMNTICFITIYCSTFRD